MSEETENHERLHAAGLIDKDHLAKNQAEHAKVASLSSDEIDSLISIGEKLGGGNLVDPDTLFF